MTNELPQGQSELTVKGINPKLNKETNIYMSEPGFIEGGVATLSNKQPIEPVIADNSGDKAGVGIFQGLDFNNPHTRQVLMQVMNLRSAPLAMREEAAASLGMDIPSFSGSQDKPRNMAEVIRDIADLSHFSEAERGEGLLRTIEKRESEAIDGRDFVEYDPFKDSFAMGMRELLDLKTQVEGGALTREGARRLLKAKEGLSKNSAENVTARLSADEITEFYTSMADTFLDPAVSDQLGEDSPDLEISKLDSFMNEFIKSSDPELGIFAELVAKAGRDLDGKYLLQFPVSVSTVREGDRDRSITNFAEIKISERARELLYEWTVERIIGIPDKGSDEADYNIGRSIQLGENQDKIQQLLFAYFNREFFERMTTLTEVRPIVHELNRIVSKSEEYTKYLAGLQMHRLDFIRNRTVGVPQVIQALESAANIRVAMTHKTFNEEDVAEVLKDVREVIMHQYDNKLLKDDKGRPLTKWEVIRALKFGKAYFSGMQRFGVYAYMGDLRGTTPERVGSSPFEYINRKIQPLKINAYRWWGGEEPTEYILHNTMNEVIEHEKPTARSRSLWGVSKEIMVVNNEYSVFDLIDSHSWRSLLVYLGNIDVREGEATRTLLDYYVEQIESKRSKNGVNLQDGVDPAFGLLGELDKNQLSAALIDHFLGQKLYQSIFVRTLADINPTLKTMLWKKMSTLNPLTLVSLRPEMLNAEEWGLLNAQGDSESLPLRIKIMLAQQARVRKDQEEYFDEQGEVKSQDLSSLSAEAKKYKDLYELEDKIRKIGLGTLSADDKVFYEKCRKGMGIKDEILDLSPADYQRWIGLDRQVVNYGFSRLNGTDRSSYEHLRESIKYRLLNNFFNAENGNSLNDTEKRLVKHVIDSGFIFSEELGVTRLPFAVAIDDAPRIALQKRGAGFSGLGDPDLIRVVNDQGTLGEGYNALNTWLEHPVHNYDEAPEKYVEEVGKVLGRHAAQEKIRHFIAAFVEGTIEKKKAKLIGSLMYENQVGRSKWEELYPTSNLAWSPEQRQNYLRGQGLKGALSVHRKPIEINGKSTITQRVKHFFRIPQFEPSMVLEIERRKKASRKHIAMDNLIKYLLIFMPEFFIQTIKGGKDASKDAIK